MIRHAVTLGLAVLLLPSLASAQDAFVGNFSLEGRYSNGRRTTADLTIRSQGGALRVQRVGRLTAPSTATFTWECQDARKVSARVLRATYRLEPQGGLSAALAALGPGSSDAAVASALSQTNVLEAVYIVSADKKSLREIIVNTTRLGAESRWRQLNASGKRVVAAPTGPISAAELRRRVDAALARWHREWTTETYTALLADADPSERADLERQRDADLDFSSNEVIEGDDLWEDNVDEAYHNDDPYHRADGSVVRRSDVKVYVLSMFPEHAGIGLSKAFVVDRRTGEVLEEGDLQD
jgi:hypothetical protein